MKLLNGNGRETEWKTEIERGTAVKTPCLAGVTGFKVYLGEMRNEERHYE